MGFYQWLAIAGIAFELLVAPLVHGKQERRNGVLMVMDALTWTAILYFGGFWK